MANDLVERIKAIYAQAKQERRRDRTEPTAPSSAPRLIPLTQVHLYVVGVAHEAGRRFCEDCLA